MSTHHHCEECWAILDPTKVLRCTKCKACRYCSRECQTRNWRLHKRVCATKPSLRPFIRVEMAVERALAKQPTVQAPKDAFCYICLEGEDDGKLMRGCACRGDSAGFVHVECLTKLAVSKEASRDPQVLFDAWNKCGNCKQDFQGALKLEMQRHFWRRYRSSQDQTFRYHSIRNLAAFLWGMHGEFDAANQLLDEASTFVGNRQQLLEMKLFRAEMLKANGQKLEALGLLQAMLPEAKVYSANPQLYGLIMLQITDVFLDLDRYQEAHEAATEFVTLCKAKYGLEDQKTLIAMRKYAVTCAKLRRGEEAKVNFKNVLTIQARILGRDHPDTQNTRECIQQFYGCVEPSG